MTRHGAPTPKSGDRFHREMSRRDIDMSRFTGEHRLSGLRPWGGRKGIVMNRGRFGQRPHRARRGLAVLLAVGAVATGLIQPVEASPLGQGPLLEMTPTSDCDDPTAWAELNGATVVELSPAFPVALLGRGGPYAVVGTSQVDLVFGSRFGDLICGYDGGDVLLGASGDDTISGGEGRDLILGGRGNDTCRDDGNDRLSSCEQQIADAGIAPDLRVRYYRDGINVTPRTSVDVLNTPVIPVVDCVRSRADGLMEAVIGHRTRDGDSYFGDLVEVDKSRRPTSYLALPEFFLAGEHEHVFAIAYDPGQPRRLELTVWEPVPGEPSIVWRTDIDLGEGPTTCGVDVPDVLPIARKSPDSFYSLEASFVGSFPPGPNQGDLHYFQVVPLADVYCTGAPASPLRFDFDMLFQDIDNVVPLNASQTVALVDYPPGPPFIQSTTPVRIFGNVDEVAGVKVDADVYGVCETATGDEVRADHPLWIVGNDSVAASVDYFVDAETGHRVFYALIGSSVGGFRRFR